MRARLSLCKPTIGKAVLFELRTSPALLVGVTLGIVGYSAGHAALALGAGSLAAGLGGAASVGWPEAWAGPVWTPTYFSLAGAIVKASSASLLAYSERTVAARTTARFRLSTLAGLLRAGSSTPAPRVLASLAVNLREIDAAIALGHLSAVRSIAQLLPLAVCLVVWSPGLSAAGVLLAMPFGWGLSVLRKRARRAAGRAQALAEELECGVDELVRNADLWRVYGAGDRVMGVVAEASRTSGVAAARVDLFRAALSGTNEVIGVLAVLGALSLGARLGGASGATLLPFAALFFMGYRPLRDFGDARSWTTRGALALDAIRSVARSLGAEAAAVEVTSARPAASILDLQCYGASSRGPRTTLTLAPGEIACLVGPTGSGKSTLIRTLLGLEPAAGIASWAGHDLTRAPAGPSHRPFAWVPQEAPLVTGTVIDNVMLIGANRADATRALAAVGADHLLAIPETEIIGPGGRPLSGGERRLLSLSRALASGLPLILLDEPTEGLDPEATRTVLAALLELRGKRTLLIATHREEVCRVADRVIAIGDTGVARAAE